jgi:hypothetical protein
MFLSWIDRELAVIDESDGSVCHVFERHEESRTAYKYMTSWIEKNWTGDFSGMWTRAEQIWERVSVENKMALWTIDQQQEQNFEDIRTGLLATLKDYQGAAYVKGMFEAVLKSMEF